MQLFRQNPDVYRDDLAMVQFNLGIVYINLEDYAKAENIFLQALENYTQLSRQTLNAYCVNLAKVQYFLGLVYFNLSDYTKSENYYHQALDNYTQLFSQAPDAYRADLADVFYNLGGVCSFLDDPAKTEDYLLKALEHYSLLYRQDPETYSVLFASSYTLLAFMYADTEDFTKALENIDHAIALMPEEADGYDSKGEILLMKGDEQEAMKMWKKVLELDPGYLDTHDSDFYKQLKENGLLDD